MSFPMISLESYRYPNLLSDLGAYTRSDLPADYTSSYTDDSVSVWRLC